MDLRGVGGADRGNNGIFLVCAEKCFLHPVTSFLVGNERGVVNRKERGA